MDIADLKKKINWNSFIQVFFEPNLIEMESMVLYRKIWRFFPIYFCIKLSTFLHAVTQDSILNQIYPNEDLWKFNFCWN